MYVRHFGMREDPFAGRPSGAALYCRSTQRELLSAVRTGLIREGGAVHLTGPAGCGKTVLCRLLLRALPASVDLLLVTHPPAQLRELLHRILSQPKFHDPGPEASTQELVDQFRAVLLRMRGRGRLPVLIIDDAQDLHPDTENALHQLRGRGAQSGPLFALLLSGRARDAVPAPRPGSRSIEIPAYSPAETADYIRHRLRSVGGSSHLFSEGAMREIHKHSDGLPRHIDILCGHALLGAYFAGAETVDWATVRATVNHDAEPSAAAPTAWPHWCKTASIFGAAFAGTLLLTLWWANLAAVDAAAPAPPTATESHSAAPAPSTDSPRPAPTSPERVAESVVARPPFTQLLTGAQADLAVAERRLIARWQSDAAPHPDRHVCASGDALHCLEGKGGWSDLERLNRPALLRLHAPDARALGVVVVGLNANAVRIDVGGSEYEYPRADIDAHWQGDYVVLWRPPIDGVSVIGRDAPPAALTWLRTSLARIDGVAVRIADPDRFDWPLTKRVKEFQQAAGLRADGTVGAATFIALQTALHAPNTPLLIAER